MAASSAFAAPIVIDRLNASVNSSIILLSDTHKFRHSVSLRSQLDPLFTGTGIASKGAEASESEITDFLVNEKVIAQAFPVTDTEAEQEINSIQASNKIDRSKLKAALEEQGFKFEDYFELIRSSAAKRNLIDRDIRTKVTISDDDVKNYFLGHYSGDAGSKAYHVKIITVSKRSFKTPAAALAAAKSALGAVKGGETFEEVAKRVSDDPSAQSGGELGVLTDDQMSPAIRNELKKMNVGQVSDILGSVKDKLFIIKLADVSSGDNQRYEKVKDEIRNQLAASEYQHQIALWLERQRQSSFIHRAGEPSVPGL